MPILLPVPKIAIKFGASPENHIAFSVELVIVKVAFINITIGEAFGTEACLLTILDRPFVRVAIHEAHSSMYEYSIPKESFFG